MQPLAYFLSVELPIRAPNPRQPTPRPYWVETKSLSYNLPLTGGKSFIWPDDGVSGSTSRTILNNVSCKASPGELLAIVGPSGAGKTTLLSVFAGMMHPSKVSGAILVNGRPMDLSSFRRISGHVTQEDALFPLLTVEESLVYSARLRLGSTSGEAEARVRELIKELGLDRVAKSRIGGSGSRGISGGERRRVSIGVELVHDPAVLLLDEPTSGLDSASALQIIKLLKSMAAVQGKTIVLTIHQPSFRILELIDQLVLIAGGTLRHHGSVALLECRLEAAGHHIPLHVNVLEFAMDTMASIDSSITETSTPPEEIAMRYPDSIAMKDQILYANSHWKEMIILSARFFKNVSRNRELFAARMIISVVAGVGLGTVFMNVQELQSRLGFFAFTLTFLLSSTTEGLPVFLQERRILMRETMRGAYRVSSYVIANALVFLPFLFAASLLYAGPVYWLVGLRKEMDRFLYLISLVIWLVMITANSFVACFGAIVPNFILGNSMIAGIMGAFFLFSGYFIEQQSIPKYWIFMNYLSLFKYPFEALLVNEYGGEKGRKECLSRIEGQCVVNGEMLLNQQGLEESHRWINVGIMLGYICGYRLLSFLVIWFRCHRSR